MAENLKCKGVGKTLKLWEHINTNGYKNHPCDSYKLSLPDN